MKTFKSHEDLEKKVKDILGMARVIRIKRELDNKRLIEKAKEIQKNNPECLDIFNEEDWGV